MKVGDFVRWASPIIENNGHLALSRERGVVVSFSADGKKANVVWNDGEAGTFPLKVLTRTVGVMGTAVKSPGEKRKPLRDRGRKPVSVPVRAPHTPLPSTNACWAMMEEKEMTGFVTDKPYKTKDGKLSNFMPFPTPIKVVEMRNIHWPAQTGNIKLSRSATTLTVTFPNGEKVSHTPTGGRTWIQHKFDESTAEVLCNTLNI